MAEKQSPDSQDDPWELLRQSRTEQALTLFRRAKAREKPPSHKRGLGEALMWSGQYVEAIAHYEESIEITKRFRMRSENDYAFLGTAHWCLEDYDSAVRRWKEGVNAPYAIGGVCTQTPLLLYAASVLRPGILRSLDAEDVIRKKVCDPRIGSRAEHWPVTLGKYVLGLISKEAMAAYWIRTTPLYDVLLERERPWRTEFYEAILRLLRDGSVIRFRKKMRQRTQEAVFNEWNLDDWMGLVQAPEFYIARLAGNQFAD